MTGLADKKVAPAEQSLSEAAARLRLAIVRTARRLRQEAAGDGRADPNSCSALATVERHGPLTPSELAEIERVKRPTATRTLGVLTEAGLVVRAPDPVDRRSALVSITPAGQERLRRLRRRKNAYLAKRMHGLAEDESRLSNGRRRSSRTSWRARSERRAATHLRLALRSELPPLFRGADRLGFRKLDADDRRGLADPPADRQRRRGGNDHRSPVPADPSLRGLGRRPGRPLLEAAAADGHSGPDGGPRARPSGGHAGRSGRAMDGVRARLPRGTVNAVDNPTRQSFAIEMVGSDRLVNAVGLNSVLIHSGRLLGPAMAALLIATAGIEFCFALNAVSFAAMIFALWRMEPAELECRAPSAAERRGGQGRPPLRARNA